MKLAAEKTISKGEKYSLQSYIDAVWEKESKPYKSDNLGASSIGMPCERALYLDFHWATNPSEIKGVMLRLFDMGAREEDIMIENLKKIGVDIRHTGPEQLKIQLAPHIIVKPDGVIYGGLPEHEEEKLAFECKTMNKANFEKVEKQSVKKAKPEYYAQAQCEMKALDVDSALFTVLCKDNSQIYSEIIERNDEYISWLLQRADKIIYQEKTLPEMYAVSPDSPFCKFCKHASFCYVSNECTEINCRTCAWCKAEGNNTWTCGVFNSEIPYSAQTKGCSCHSFKPCLVPYEEWKECSVENKYIAFKKADGTSINNGYGFVESKDLHDKMIPLLEPEFDPLNINF